MALDEVRHVFDIEKVAVLELLLSIVKLVNIDELELKVADFVLGLLWPLAHLLLREGRRDARIRRLVHALVHIDFDLDVKV